MSRRRRVSPVPSIRSAIVTLQAVSRRWQKGENKELSLSERERERERETELGPLNKVCLNCYDGLATVFRPTRLPKPSVSMSFSTNSIDTAKAHRV